MGKYDEMDEGKDADVLDDLTMYKGIDIDINEFRMEIDGKEITAKGHYWGKTQYKIESFVKRIEAGELIFSKWRVEEEASMAAEYLPNKNMIQSLRRPDYRLSERVELFYQCYERLDLLFGFDLTNEEFLKLVTEIRIELQTDDFKKKIRRRLWKSERNRKSAIKYVRELWEIYAKLLVLRIDFSYRKDAWERVLIEDAKSDFNKFINSKRFRSIFSNLAGYIWKLECGEEKGLHFHFIFLFDGSRVHKDAYLASLIGKYWDENITGGRGMHYNCNRDRNQYKNIGIGMISHNDTLLRGNMEKFAIAYLTKKDQYLICKRAGDRTFGKGIMPPAREQGGGRPRRAKRASLFQ